MNNYILISRTYSEATPESSEHGDFSDNGFIIEEDQITFRDLVQFMKEHPEPSCSPDNGDVNTWYSTGFYTSDYGTGTEREECIHFHKNNTPNIPKYWTLARKMANKRNYPVS